MSFLEVIKEFHPKDVAQAIEAKGPEDVEHALGAKRLSLDDFMALLSPCAEAYLEEMAQKAHAITVKRFGKTILLYAPLYISNECSNSCSYCGFNVTNKIPRKTLTLDEIEEEAKVLHNQGFRHVLLLTGEAPSRCGLDYIEAAIRRIRPLFSSIAVEIYPLDEAGYRRLINAGVDGLTVYQETYDKDLYLNLHPRGKKRDYVWRLLTPERGGRAGMRRIGIGALLGLSDFRVDGFYTGLHAMYLQKHFWRTQVTVSFPRIRPAEGGFRPLSPVTDKNLVQLICAMRLLIHDAGLVLSTRESAELRNNLLPLGITQMSAGSCTAPGGYSHKADTAGQFEIHDTRTPEDVFSYIRSRGYDPVWKDWDTAFLSK
ncbi:2-iminoacetate synthase ThiH [Dissulfuribacter thermophilus]|uniref:2-iminoacetate synthase ThiH n=1 Tax=Dissulfuribacter thermophilus TaxID=1156395 RepID=A0A1B9F5U1_9BACT|nr:2-iminoacetate synthase ThiH [Dissulfuribacter thermophilus]OCC15243.1 2-iminoacetate synthase ThiH [Dissulfuribacter thermophilus]